MLLIALLAALPLGGFARHVFLQLEELSELNLRSLSKASTDIAELVENAKTVVSSLDEKPAFACELDDQQRFLKLFDSPFDCESGKRPPDERKDWVERSDSPSGWFVASKDNKSTFEIQLDEILSALPAGDQIDLLLIVQDKEAGTDETEEKGQVVASYKRSTGFDVAINNLSALRDPTGSPIKDLNLSATIVEDVMLSGMSLDFICQPVRSITDINAGQQIAVCGLLDSSREMGKALTVTPLIVVVLLAVVIFGVLCWPMLKVVLMSDRERFKFSDLYFVLFGAWGAVMIVVILALAFQTHLELTSKIEDSNELIADEVNERLLRELEGLSTQLHTFDGVAESLEGCTELHAKSPGWRPTFESDFEMVFWVNPDQSGQQVKKATTMRTTTPLVKLANREYFKHARDDKLWKVGNRHWYVENVRSKTTTAVRTLLSARSSQCVTYSVENVTRDEDNRLDCFAPGYDLNLCESSADNYAVIAVQARLISVAEPVLSPGVGFAVIDDSGRAIFHSDPRRALKDNFFDELSDGMRLRATVLSHTEHHMGSNYLGRPHQFFVKPMAQLPWTIVVFSDNEPKRVVILEIVGHAILLAFIFLVINLVGTLVYLAWEGQEIPRWFWPTPCSGIFHAKWSFFLALVFILFVAGLSQFSLDFRLLLCLAVPASILVLILVTSRRAMYVRLRGIDQPVGRMRLSPRLWYVVASGLLWLNVAVVPAYVFYSNALTAAMAEFVKQENVVHGENLEARQCSMSEYYSEIPRDCEGKNQCECHRGNACRDDIYRSAIYDPDQALISPSPVTDDASSSIWKLFAKFKPIYSDSIGYRRYLYQQDHDPWNVNENGEITYRHPHPVCGEAEEIRSILPITGSDLKRLEIVLSLIGLLLFGFAWLRFVANKLYFYEIEECGPLGLDDVMERDSQVLAFIASDNDRERLSSSDGSDLTVHKIQGPIDGNKRAELQSLVETHDRLLVLAEYDSLSFNSQAPEGMVVKWFARGEANNSPYGGLVGGDHWRRHLNGAIDGDWINHELATSSDLFSPKRSQLVRTILTDRTTKREALLQLSEAMHDYYQTLWQQCSQEERFVLVQLIEEAVVNPKQANVVRTLMRRGIIRRDPALRTMNESFAQWVADTHAPENLEKWEESSDGANWSQLRWVFVSVLILIFAFLWFTQRHVVESGLAFLSIAGIAIPSLLKLASTIRVLGGQADN